MVTVSGYKIQYSQQSFIQLLTRPDPAYLLLWGSMATDGNFVLNILC